MNTLVTYVCYTHYDYRDIWPLVFGQLEEHIKFHKVIFSNKFDNSIILKNTDIVLYDDSLTYSTKLGFLCDQIDTPYIILVHDNDIVMNFNNDLCKTFITQMIDQKIDRLMFGVLSKGTESFVDATTNKSKHFITPYDVGPSIWKRESLQSLMKMFNNRTYRDIELCSELQEFCSINFKTVGRTSKDPSESRYSIGRPFNKEHCFCHILIRRQWLDFYLYMDFKFILLYLINKYNIRIEHRGILYNQNHIDVNCRDV